MPCPYVAERNVIVFAKHTLLSYAGTSPANLATSFLMP